MVPSKPTTMSVEGDWANLLAVASGSPTLPGREVLVRRRPHESIPAGQTGCRPYLGSERMAVNGPGPAPTATRTAPDSAMWTAAFRGHVRVATHPTARRDRTQPPQLEPHGASPRKPPNDLGWRHVPTAAKATSQSFVASPLLQVRPPLREVCCECLNLHSQRLGGVLLRLRREILTAESGGFGKRRHQPPNHRGFVR
jgi:hypothetical protein